MTSIGMQRSMSYRKPVPEYLPSPPSSPLQELRQAVDEDEKHLPPLPHNWREIVATKIVEVKSTNPASSATADQKMVVELEEVDSTERESQSFSPDTFVGGDQRSLRTPQGSQIFHPHSHRGRGLPTNYRPPTPPLRSQSKQSRHIPFSGGKMFEAVTLYSQANPSLYPASHASSKDYSQSMQAGLHTASLRPTPSFHTERTMMSMNTNMSMGWSHPFGGASERGLYSSPTLFMQKQKSRAEVSANGHDARREHYCSSSILCGRWSNRKLGNSTWARKLRKFFGVSK
ncbi:hypothetical protein CPB84DRAFT_1758025 [Gymnopilus junonius]|uniref:Uncharacterized protein n=1 Tax=Gymnopilus junonius TaxID=109634 RepID=A0A9P5P1P6_GYMJU|nr:hypothetical protein CPB84DRAFT_1758025 [Gymnopilus junonius]